MFKEHCDVLFISASYGGGHTQVARALSLSLQYQAPGIKTEIVDFNELLVPLFNRLTQFGYKQSIRHFPIGYGLYYQATKHISSASFWQKRLNRLGYAELCLLTNRLQPKVVVSTFPLPSGVLSRMKESGDLFVPLVTVITDNCVHNQWIHPYTDLYLVGSPEVANGLAARGVPRERIAPVGIPIMPSFAFPMDRNETFQQFDLSQQGKVILVMGGRDGFLGPIHFHKILNDLPPETQIILLTGLNMELYEKFQALREKYPKQVRVYKFVDNMAALMAISDVLVTKAGGITISEALARALPMIIYNPIPGHEEANANYLWRHRAAIIAKSERRLRTALHRLVTDENFRLRLSRNGQKISYPRAAEQGARLILTMMAPGARNSNTSFRSSGLGKTHHWIR